MILSVLGFGGHVLELTIGHLLADELSRVLRSLAPERRSPLAGAVDMAWRQAVDDARAGLRTDDQRAIAAQLRPEGARLLANAADGARVAAIHALILGDATALKRPMGSMIAGYLRDLAPAERNPFEDALAASFIVRFASVLRQDVHEKAWKVALRDILQDLHRQNASLSAEQASGIRDLLDAIDRQTQVLSDIPTRLQRMEDASRNDAAELRAAMDGSSANVRGELRELGDTVVRDLDSLRALVQRDPRPPTMDDAEPLGAVAARIRRIAFTWKHDVAGRPHLLRLLLDDRDIRHQRFLRDVTARRHLAESLDALLRKIRPGRPIAVPDDVDLSGALIRIFRRSRELRAPTGGEASSVPLWRALGEDAVTLMGASGPRVGSDEEWGNFLSSNPLVLAALRRDTPYVRS